MEEELWDKSFNINISYEVMGEEASRWLLRRHVSKRGSMYIQELLINNKISNDFHEIEE